MAKGKVTEKSLRVGQTVYGIMNPYDLDKKRTKQVYYNKKPPYMQ